MPKRDTYTQQERNHWRNAASSQITRVVVESSTFCLAQFEEKARRRGFVSFVDCTYVRVKRVRSLGRMAHNSFFPRLSPSPAPLSARFSYLTLTTHSAYDSARSLAVLFLCLSYLSAVELNSCSCFDMSLALPASAGPSFAYSVIYPLLFSCLSCFLLFRGGGHCQVIHVCIHVCARPVSPSPVLGIRILSFTQGAYIPVRII